MTRTPSRPTARGWPGPGGGSSTYLQPPDEWRGTTNQVCGLDPWAVGTGVPTVGVPLGRHTITGATVCCDPVSWFRRAQLIHNPSEFLLGKAGLGKSSLLRRQVLGLAGYGVLPLVLGDLRPDYTHLITALGGQVVRVGPGRGTLNVLDPGEATAVAGRLSGNARTEVLADARNRREAMVAALVTILRAAPPRSREVSILNRALRVMDERLTRVPVLDDLLQVVREGPDDVRRVAVDRGDRGRYEELTEDLEADLVALCDGTSLLGDTFTGHTTTPLRRDVPVCVDVSGVDKGQKELQAAIQLASWSAGFAMVNQAQALADAGLEAQRHYFVVMDELGLALRSGPGMVDRVDVLTRLNREFGVGMAMCTHTLSDLDALPLEEDRAKARGFVERAGLIIAAGLPQAEMAKLRQVVPFSDREEELLVGWTDPPVWDSAAGAPADPPGRGNFGIKVGGRPMIPLHVQLTSVELGVNDTNRRWHQASRIGRVTDLAAVQLAEEGAA